MISTVPPTNSAAAPGPVRRPALFLSPASSGAGNLRTSSGMSSSPSITPKMQPQLVSSSNNGTSGTVSPTTDVTSGLASNNGVQTEVRLAVLGALGVGKSALVVKYMTKRFIMEYDPNLEDIYSRTENIDGRNAVIKIMDTCDSDEKKPERYLKWASGFIVVYSIVSKESYDDAARYLEQLSKHQRQTSASEMSPMVLVGNKADLERYRTVSRADAESLASQYECGYYETSAAEDYSSVYTAFSRVVNDVLLLLNRQPSLQSLFITEDRNKSTSKTATSLMTSDQTATPSAGNTVTRRSTAAFNLLNKGFKYFTK